MYFVTQIIDLMSEQDYDTQYFRITERLQEAQKCVRQEQQQCPLFLEWRPAIPPMGHVIQFHDGMPRDAHRLTAEELKAAQLPEDARVFVTAEVGRQCSGMYICLAPDILHNEMQWRLNLENINEENLSRIPAMRIEALNALTDAIYQVPDRDAFVKKLQQQYTDNTHRPDLDALRMMYSTDAMSYIPSTKQLIEEDAPTLEQMRGFVQSSPYGMDAGMRLLQQFEYHIASSFPANEVICFKDLHKHYANALRELGNTCTPEQCVEALSMAINHWCEMFHRNPITNVWDDLRFLMQQIETEMQRPFDRMFSDILNIVPPEQKGAIKGALMLIINDAAWVRKDVDMLQMQIEVLNAWKQVTNDFGMIDVQQQGCEILQQYRLEFQCATNVEIQQRLQGLNQKYNNDISAIFRAPEFHGLIDDIYSLHGVDEEYDDLYDVDEEYDEFPDEDEIDDIYDCL